MAHPEAEGRQTGQIVVGIVLVAVGILFLGQQIDLWEGWSFRRLWPVVPMIVGLSHLVAPRHSEARVSGLVLVASATVLLLHTTGTISMRDTWPLFIVIGGLSMMLGGVVRKRMTGRVRSDSHAD